MRVQIVDGQLSDDVGDRSIRNLCHDRDVCRSNAGRRKAVAREF